MSDEQTLADKDACVCSTLQDFAVVRMGDSEGLDKRVFESVEQVADHGGQRWWLYASQCSKCYQAWMIAQEERIHDNYYLKRISTQQLAKIAGLSEWPGDFLRFEDVIRLGPDNDQICRFLNTDDLTDTVKELIEDRPEITKADVAYLFCLSERAAERLMSKAKRTSWAKLRPFA